MTSGPGKRAPTGARFFARPSEVVAPALLGALIITEIDGVRTAGRIVETEAYLGPGDDASHAAARIGRTTRNAVMFGDPGVAYVYRSYGIHWCLNAVTNETGFPAAVLIRAIEPVAGIDMMRLRRGLLPDAPESAVGRGPGNLTKALGITGSLDGHRLDRPPLIITRGRTVPESAIATGPRIGISRATDWPLRFWIRGHPAVSRNRS
jgi:DNA-3-methyladenine glycosylase